jgi:PAS domain S-box-containing protein
VTTAFDPRAFVHSAGDAIVAAGSDGKITLWNAAAERVFGFSAADAIGKSLDLIVPEKHRAAHWAGYDRVMASGSTRYGDRVLRVPALHARGHPLSIAFTVTLLSSSGGGVSGIAAIVRDETERWAEERGLRRRIAELEVAR